MTGLALTLVSVLGLPLALLAAKPAPVKSGLAFGITLGEGGQSVSGSTFTLRVPGAKGGLLLYLDGVGLAGDGLEASAHLTNRTGFDVFALRLDLLEASETSRADAGRSSVSRALPAAAVSSPAWSTLPSGKESDPQRFRVAPIGFGSDTALVHVIGVVSGVALVAAFEVEGLKQLASIEVDRAGFVFLTDTSGKVFRTGSDGSGAVAVRTAPAATMLPGGPCDRHLKAGRICRESSDGTAWTLEGGEVSLFDAQGLRVRSFPAGGAEPPVALALGKDGLVYVAIGGQRPGNVRVFRVF